MRFNFLILLALLTSVVYSQNESVTVEIESNDKGFLLPRLADTSTVTTPREGLLIYDASAKSPAYYNGNNWNAILSSQPQYSTTADSFTYTIVNPAGTPAGSFMAGTYPCEAVSYGLLNPNSGPFFVNMTQPRDENTIAFLLWSSGGLADPPDDMEIEFNFYTNGVSTPNFSVKISDLKIDVTQLVIGSGSFGLSPLSITISAQKICLNDHQFGQSFCVDGTGNVSSY